MTASALLLAAGLAFQGQAPAPPAPADALGQAYYLFIQGRSLEDRGDVSGAITAYRKAIALQPKAAELHAELAAVYARQGQLSEATTEAQAALALDAHDPEANRIVGLIQADSADRATDTATATKLATEAIGHLEYVLADGRRDPGVELTLGRLDVTAGRYAKAIATLRNFLLEQPGYADAETLLAQAYDANGQTAEAIGVLEDAVTAQPDQVQLRSWLAQLYEKAGRWKDAAASWGELAKRNPRSTSYPLRQASALVNSGDLDAGRQQLDAITKASPSNIAAWYLLSQVERRAGDADAAEVAARHIATVDASDPRGPLALAEAQTARGDYAAAVATLEPHVKAPSDDDISSGVYARMAGDLAAALQQSGDPDRAVQVLEQARQKAPDDTDVQFSLAAAYDRDAHQDRAEQIFRDLIAQDPTNADALNYLGYMLADHNQKLPEALGFIKRALAVAPDNPSYLDSLGWAYVKLSQLDQAREPLERAAAALPKVSVIQDHLGELYFQLKRYKDAAEAWDHALAGDRQDIDVAAVTRKRDRARQLAGKE
jgi:tetratricopeptide (TPR) repeat protein